MLLSRPLRCRRLVALESLRRQGIVIDVAFTSLLKRAQQTLDIVMRITGQEDVPVHQNWRLNERMCTRPHFASPS
jgi:2,3-bisphosphoglycerate-dependent phosphoglycerate mutase